MLSLLFFLRFTFLKFWNLSMSVCLCVCVYVWVCVFRYAWVWWSGNNLDELVLSVYHVYSGNRTQAMNLTVKFFFLMSHHSVLLLYTLLSKTYCSKQYESFNAYVLLHTSVNTKTIYLPWDESEQYLYNKRHFKEYPSLHFQQKSSEMVSYTGLQGIWQIVSHF